MTLIFTTSWGIPQRRNQQNGVQNVEKMLHLMLIGVFVKDVDTNQRGRKNNMSRLVFLFMSDGNAPAGSNPPWSTDTLSQNKFIKGLWSEGYYYLLIQMLKTNIINDLVIVIESNRSPGLAHTKEGIPVYVVPNIDQFEPYIKPDDIIWARGGFKSWFPFLNNKKGKHWLLIYAANTGRQRWKFWDVVFNDLHGKNHIDSIGRFQFDFKKPINPDIFKLLKKERTYDICIGASYIHDRKGQWLVINSLIEYQNIYGEKPKCILPGAPRRGLKSALIPELIRKHQLDVTITGMLPREDLAERMNECRLFIHGGSSGQNDRGPLEAMRCGCYIMLASSQHHPKFLYQNGQFGGLVISQNPYIMAKQIRDRIWYNIFMTDLPKSISDYYDSKAGISNIILPEMRTLFDIMKKNKPGDGEAFRGFCSR